MNDDTVNVSELQSNQESIQSIEYCTTTISTEIKISHI